MNYALFLIAHFILMITLPDCAIEDGTSPSALESHNEFWKSVDSAAFESVRSNLSANAEEAAKNMLLGVRQRFASSISSSTSSSPSSSSASVSPDLPVRFIGVFDEARALLSRMCNDGPGRTISVLRLLRRAMTALFDPMLECGCWFLLLDTTSTVSNFVPPAMADPSYRGGLNQADSGLRRLLPPFYNLPVLVRVPEAAQLASISDDLDMCVFLRGRPLWQSYFINENMLSRDRNNTASVSAMMRKVLKVAKVKLLGGADDVTTFGHLLSSSRSQPIEVSAACLSVCGNLVQCIDPFSTSAVSSQMLSSHMVRCHHPV
jgi:hypothetical protein